ncbi:MAG: hypothetical protein NTZ83_00780 [Candidatus Pacearchaeota archaeon]|nr:hypothetical protein [Candidatus Pacearchaeota archaeon]
MKEESIFHIKVDYEEAVQSKKYLLSSERDFLNVLKIMRRYNLLRKEELNNKLRMQNKIRDLKANLTRINDILPKIKIPDFLKKKNVPEKEGIEGKPIKTKTRVKEATEEDDLEIQLKEIQERLRKLE